MAPAQPEDWKKKNLFMIDCRHGRIHSLSPWLYRSCPLTWFSILFFSFLFVPFLIPLSLLLLFGSLSLSLALVSVFLSLWWLLYTWWNSFPLHDDDDRARTCSSTLYQPSNPHAQGLVGRSVGRSVGGWVDGEACASGWLHKIYIIFIPLIFVFWFLFCFSFLLLEAVFILDTGRLSHFLFPQSPRFLTIQRVCMHNLKLYNLAALLCQLYCKLASANLYRK